MNSNIYIRLATPKDAQIIALLARVTFTETFQHYFDDRQDLLDYFEDTFSVEKIERSLEKSNNVFWLAFVNELPVGYAKVKLNSSSPFVTSKSTCQLQKIYVLKDFLSLKIGFQLQEHLLAKALELGFKAIWLSVLDENVRAINFYKKTGFNHVGAHDFTIGKEHFEFIVLSKTLRE